MGGGGGGGGHRFIFVIAVCLLSSLSLAALILSAEARWLQCFTIYIV